METGLNIQKKRVYFVQIGLKKGFFDAFGQDVLNSILELGIEGISKVNVYDVYKVYGEISFSLVKKISKELLFDPVAHEMKIYSHSKDKTKLKIPSIEVWYKTGVTDPVAFTAIKGIKDLGVLSDIGISCGKKFEFFGSGITKEKLETIATKILANTLIQDFFINGI
ncbi:MAG: phosphoribosylformylglycinamidine synthase subunit PurS [Candidatus Omnitrophica bacterium]|nr:phosphoribosylformylglycinamidine synthase subunit PurS [Candidatus Omnitrophota bacterium]